MAATKQEPSGPVGWPQDVLQPATHTERHHRRFEVVVWGSTGFTGELVCEHIVTSYTEASGHLKWAMAGRDSKKLHQLRDKLALIHFSPMQEVPILTADAKDAEAIACIVSQTQVVIAVAGPFCLHGAMMIEQCLKHGTHYVDVTAEVPWVRQNMEKYHAMAVSRGVKIVHCCGYDSIPADIGVLMLVQYAKHRLNRGVDQVYSLVHLDALLGGLSGGTISTAFALADNYPQELKVVLKDEYYLASYHNRDCGSDKPPAPVIRYNEYARTWTAPFLMEFCNGRVVHLSDMLAANTPLGRYGKDFKYMEVVETGDGLWGFSLAVLVWCYCLLGFAITYFSMLRYIMQRWLPRSHEGPKDHILRRSQWHHDLVALTEGPEPKLIRGTVGDDHRDSCYLGAARMLLEAAMCLVHDEHSITAAGLPAGGVLTPATAMGMPLVKRLQVAGINFQISEVCDVADVLAGPQQAQARRQRELGAKLEQAKQFLAERRALAAGDLADTECMKSTTAPSTSSKDVDTIIRPELREIAAGLDPIS